MLTDLATEITNVTVDILEGFMLAFVGVKPSRRRKVRQTRARRTKQRQERQLVLNRRAQLRLAGKLFENLPRDVAISVLNDIKLHAR